MAWTQNRAAPLLGALWAREGDHDRCADQAVIAYGLRSRALAACLSALAGYVDALGFLKLRGFFVSFMSGDSTRLGVALGVGHGLDVAKTAAGLVAAFMIGVMLGAFVSAKAKRRRRVTVLGLVAGLLTLAAALAALHWDRAAVAAMALAMGAENATFEQNGEVSVGLTYMTGALVKTGQRLVMALLGGDRWAWLASLVLWVGLVCGAVLGALAYATLGLGGLWFAAGAAALLTLAAQRLAPED